MVLLAAEFLKESKAFVEEGVHPQVGVQLTGNNSQQGGCSQARCTVHRSAGSLLNARVLNLLGTLVQPVCRASSAASARRRSWRWAACASWRWTLAARTLRWVGHVCWARLPGVVGPWLGAVEGSVGGWKLCGLRGVCALRFLTHI